MDIDIEKIIVNMREDLYSCGYTNTREIYKNEFEFMLELSTNIPVQDLLKVNSQPSMKIYEFAGNGNKIIRISKRFFICELHVFEPFEKYSGMVCKFLENVMSEVSSFRIKRIGLRKFNTCYFRDMNIIKDYFCNFTKSEKNEYNYISSNYADLYKKDEFKIKLSKNIQSGIIQDGNISRNAFQMIYDIDVFSDDLLYFDTIKSKEQIGTIETFINKINDIVFDNFISGITEKFYQLLCEEKFEDDNVEGVRDCD